VKSVFKKASDISQNLLLPRKIDRLSDKKKVDVLNKKIEKSLKDEKHNILSSTQENDSLKLT